MANAGEVLACRGYQTAGFSANKEYVSYQTGLARGFARFEDFRVSPGQILLSSSPEGTSPGNAGFSG